MSRLVTLLGLAATQLLAGVEGMQCQKFHGYDWCKGNEGCCGGGNGCFAYNNQISVCVSTCPAAWGCSSGHTCQEYQNYLLCKGNEGCCPSGTRCQAYSNQVSVCMASCPAGWACNSNPQPNPGPTPGCKGGRVFKEKNGYLVVEAEDVKLASGWRVTNSFPEKALGRGHLEFVGKNSMRSPQMETAMKYEIEITTPGTYQFKWRSRNGKGAVKNDEENDSWLKIDADEYYGMKGNQKVSIGDHYAKVWIQTRYWSWNSNGEHNHVNGMQMFAVFNRAGMYSVHIAGRSHGHVIDRLALYKQGKGNMAMSDSTQPSGASNCNGGGQHAPGLRPKPQPQPQPKPKPQAKGFVKSCGPFKVNTWKPEIQITYENGKVQGRDAIQFTVTFPSNGNGAKYTSFGFDEAGSSQMPGLDVMTVDSETKGVEESAVLKALAPPPKDPKQDSTLVSHSKVGGKTTVKFYRLMDTGNDFVLRPGLKVSIGWAYGSGSVFAGTMRFHDEWEHLQHTMGRC